MKTSKILGVIFTVVAATLMVSKANAAQLKNTVLTLSDETPGAASSYTLTFKHTTGATIKAVTVEFCKKPSGTCTKPTNLTLKGPNPIIDPGAFPGLTAGNWGVTLGGTDDNMLIFANPTGDAVVADAAIGVGILSTDNANPGIGDCGGSGSTDTCYVSIVTYSDAATFTTANKIDEALASFTVVKAVKVTARVDPTFSFVVSAVDAGKTNNQITTSVSSTFSTLPFGNLTANIPKYAAHQLNVTTNTQGGYQVTAAMQSQMTGVFVEDNIDPFTSLWSAKSAWTHPSGQTPNDNSGWFGANTTDIRVANWNNAPEQKFGGVSSTPVQVMHKTNSDDGTLGIYVTYAIEANVFQPADSYTGVLVYNALPTY